MRYLTRDLEKKMQFFSIAHKGMTLQSLAYRWSNSECPLDVFDVFYRDIEVYKSDMLRLLPEELKRKLFNDNGSIKRKSLNDELYQELVGYKRNFMKEWEEACNALSEERKTIEKAMHKSIKRLAELPMHDEHVTSIHLENETTLIIELEEHVWGQTRLIFSGVERVAIPCIIYPICWLYEELIGAESGLYELNVLFNEGETSIVFSDFRIEVETKKYITGIIDEFSTIEAMKKIDEFTRNFIRITGHAPGEEDMSLVRRMASSDNELFTRIASCIGHKKNFVGEDNLSNYEENILLLYTFICDLIYDSVDFEYGYRRGGIDNIEAYPKTKLDRIIELLEIVGPEYLYKAITRARKVFEEKKAREKLKLNARIKLKYNLESMNIDEVYTAFTKYIKTNLEYI